MFTKDDFLASVRHETAVAKHLFEKLPGGALDKALGDGMRTTLELLRYLPYCGYIPLHCSLERCWDKAAEVLAEGGHKEMPAEDFPRRMDEQVARITEILAPFSDAELRERKGLLPWGSEDAMGRIAVNCSLAFLTAYRMQLFLHAKTAGASDLTTMNCWLGKDAPPPTE